MDNFPLFQDISEALGRVSLTGSWGTENFKAMGRVLMLQKPFSTSAHSLESRDEMM